MRDGRPSCAECACNDVFETAGPRERKKRGEERSKSECKKRVLKCLPQWQAWLAAFAVRFSSDASAIKILRLRVLREDDDTLDDAERALWSFSAAKSWPRPILVDIIREIKAPRGFNVRKAKISIASRFTEHCSASEILETYVTFQVSELRTVESNKVYLFAERHTRRTCVRKIIRR